MYKYRVSSFKLKVSYYDLKLRCFKGVKITYLLVICHLQIQWENNYPLAWSVSISVALNQEIIHVCDHYLVISHEATSGINNLWLFCAVISGISNIIVSSPSK